MDEIESTRLLSQALTLPKFHNETQQIQQQKLQAQLQPHHPLTSLLHKLPITTATSTTAAPAVITTADNTPTTPRSRSISSSNPLNEFLKPHSILSQNNSSESDDDDSSHHDEINLYPLSNQVGGHTRLLLLNEKTVIKPLNIRELEFYQYVVNHQQQNTLDKGQYNFPFLLHRNIPSDIQHFVPKYKGEFYIIALLCMYVQFVKCEMKVNIKEQNFSSPLVQKIQ